MLLLLLCQAERKELVMNDRDIIDNFIKLLPLWHYKVERPIKRTQKHSQISYETHYCLIALAKKGPMTMSELSSFLKLSKQQATQIIDKLYQHHLIQRFHDEKDRRMIRIAISEEGTQFLKENVIDSASVEASMPLTLDEKEKEELRNATDTLIRLLTKLD